MRFQALELSLEVIRSLRQPVRQVRSRDPRLAEQLRSAASSAALNLGEGARRSGRDRIHHFRIAAGSAAEVRVALRVAEAWGDLEPKATAQPLELLDRLLAVTWRLVN